MADPRIQALAGDLPPGSGLARARESAGGVDEGGCLTRSGNRLSTADEERYERVLRDTLAFSEGERYRGHNKHDGLNSPLLSGLLGWSKWSRIVAIQAVMRSPWNVRGLLGVPKTRNPKGQALFAQAWLDLHALRAGEEDLEAACRLLDWLLDHPSQGFSGLSWGYPYDWQDIGFLVPTDHPNRVVTCWIGLAMVEAAKQTSSERFVNALERISLFLLGEPRILQDDESMLALTYVPDESVSVAVMDVPALTGAFVAEAGALLGRDDLLRDARRLLNWVADKQTPYGAWFYTHPGSDSHITHDNYHTAIILDCFDRYREATGDESFAGHYLRGLEYYRDHLIDPTGAPHWMHDGSVTTRYPIDIHGCGSAILCFTRASKHDPEYAELARRTLDWTLEHMYDPRGFFYYQKTRYRTKRFCLLRWCNGWMCRALASFLRRPPV